LNATRQLTRSGISSASEQYARKVNLSKLEFTKIEDDSKDSRLGASSRKLTKMNYHRTIRFIVGRERQTIIYCDNRTNFSGAAGALKRMDMDLGFKYSSCQRIVWKSI
jgi:hypothetical protein